MITIEITHQVNSQLNDEYYIRSIKRIHKNLTELVGPFLKWDRYPRISRGQGWAIYVGEPEEQQRYYVEIDAEELAMLYILKYV